MLVFMKRNIAIIFLFMIILGCGIFIFRSYKEKQAYHHEQSSLVAQLRQATEIQKEAIITRRISTQLEEIAYQQKEISDVQRQEAVNQTMIADQMRNHAEEEREKALSAQQAALEAFNQMEEQKKIAEIRREEAIRAQMKADTLASIALGRSLGSQASTQYIAGNRELALLLSYSAWKFTSGNNGDVYQPAIFDALLQTGDLSKSMGLHKGAIRDLCLSADERGDFLLSAGQFGELILWRINDDDLVVENILVNNPVYDFRRVVADTKNKRFIALSYTNKLIIVDSDKKIQEILLPSKDVIGMEMVDDEIFIVFGKGDIYTCAPDKWDFSLFYKHTDNITAFSATNEKCVIGDNKGGVFYLDAGGNALLLSNRMGHQVACAQALPQTVLYATGYKNGLVVISDKQANTSKELIGHISPVTEIRYANGKLFTSSYDGTVRLWNIANESNIVSSIVYQPQEWIHTFVIDKDGKRIFAGDEKGILSMIPIFPEQMAEQIRKRLVRNFTHEEWQYYIGELSNYETYN